MYEITVIGPGRLGGALALALSESGSKIQQIVCRSRTSGRKLASKFDPPPQVTSIQNLDALKTDVFLITVPDDEIPGAVSSLVGHVEDAKAVFHTSGSLSSEILTPLRSKIGSVASLHPLASVSNWKDRTERFKGAYFCLEGDAQAVRIGKRLVSQLNGRSFEIDTAHKALYHAAALTAAGHVTALFDIALNLMVNSGIDRRMARRLLQPLLSGVAQNLEFEDTPAALTGTYARADEGTMNRHLTALCENATKDEFLIYVELALRSIELAERVRDDGKTLEAMRKTLMVAKRKFEC